MDFENSSGPLAAAVGESGSLMLLPPVAGQSESAASIPAQDEENFGEIRAYFEEAEMSLMNIATPKTNNETERHRRHLQKQNSSNNNWDNTVGMRDKYPAYYCDLFVFPMHEGLWRGERAWRVLFHHVVKMDEGHCSSLYKSVLLSVYNTFYSEDSDEGYGMEVDEECYRMEVDEEGCRMDEVVRKLAEIVELKGKGSTEEVIVGNATTDIQIHNHFMDDGGASQIMRWAISNRRPLQEVHFRDERIFFSDKNYYMKSYGTLGMVDILYDHIEELDGGQYRYEYITAFRKLFKQIRTPSANWIEEVEVMFKQIALKKMNMSETKYQEVSNLVEKRMCHNDMKWFKGDEDDGDEWNRKLYLTANLISIIYRHLLILRRCDCLVPYCDCLVQYMKAFDIIKDIYVVMILEMNSSEVPREVRRCMDRLYERYLDFFRNKLGQQKMNGSNISKQKENIVAATATYTEKVSSSYIVPDDGDADVRPVIEPRHNWLDSSEILQILENFKSSEISKEIQQKPPSGSLILYDTKTLRIYKKDGYNWQKQKDGKTATEGHKILKVEGHTKLNCYYAHTIDDDNFQRRTYSLYKEESSGPRPYSKDARCKSSPIRLVHYLDVSSEDNDKSENVGREAEDNALDVVRVKSAGTSSRTKKRPRRDSDGDEMNKEIDNQVHVPQNANRAISTNTSSLDDEMVLLANEVESLPGFGRGSNWFIPAMVLFKDKDNKALFKAMPDPNSKVDLLKRILEL